MKWIIIYLQNTSYNGTKREVEFHLGMKIGLNELIQVLQKNDLIEKHGLFCNSNNHLYLTQICTTTKCGCSSLILFTRPMNALLPHYVLFTLTSEFTQNLAIYHLVYMDTFCCSDVT